MPNHCPACRLPLTPRGGHSTLGTCPRCDAIVPGWSGVDANAWLASTVLAELRASRAEQRAAPRRPRRAPPARAAS